MFQNALHRHDPRARETSSGVRRLTRLRGRGITSACPAAGAGSAERPRRALRLWSHVWGGPGWGWHPFTVVAPIFVLFFVLLAIIGVMVIFVWLVRWATHGYPFYGHGSHHGHGGCPCCGGAGTAAPPSTFLMSALPRARSTRPSSRRSASCSAGKAGGGSPPGRHMKNPAHVSGGGVAFVAS